MMIVLLTSITFLTLQLLTFMAKRATVWVTRTTMQALGLKMDSLSLKMDLEASSQVLDKDVVLDQ